MKNSTQNIFFLIVTITSILLSCKKEYSYEGRVGTDKAPFANAGTDTIIVLPVDSIILNGNNSYDADGSITKYLWTKISGPVSSLMMSPQTPECKTKALVKGIYCFELTVTDSGGLSAKDSVIITVDSVLITNYAPVANAGPDMVITPPDNSATLNG